MKTILKTTASVLLLFLMGCSSDDSSGNDSNENPSNNLDTNVYVSGSGYVGTGTGIGTPIYWQGNNMTILPKDVDIASTNGIAVHNDDIYVTGSNGLNATYWKNGLANQLYNDPVYESYTRGVFVENNDVYIIGGKASVGFLWKNGTLVQEFPYPLSGIDFQDIHVNQNDIYIVGRFFVDEGSGGVAKVTLWENGVLSHLGDGFATGVFVSDNNDVYVSGKKVISLFNERAYYWKNGVRTELFGDNIDVEATAVYVHNEDVYVSGRDGNRPVYWKNGNINYLSDDHLTKQIANDIVVINDDVYVVGITNGDDDNESRATYWKNGNMIELADGEDFSEANSIFIQQ